MADKITADVRNSFGKGAARKLRALGKIPAVIYGHGAEPQHVSLPGHEVSLIIRKANAVLELDIAGKTSLALVKDVQKDPVRQIIEHLDLILVRLGEKVQVEIPIRFEGESAPGTLSNIDLNTVLLEVEATHIPESVTVDIEGLRDGAQITAGDLKLPTGASLITEASALVVGIVGESDADLGDEPEAEEAPAEGAEAPAEES
jgi:large subunit ribosomal protein L25